MELVRHRKFSFIQESTRYCNYSNDKFGSEITCIKPSNWSNEEYTSDQLSFIDSLEAIERSYMALLVYGWKPEQARAILPNALKTEIVLTGFAEDWSHFFEQRALDFTGKAHPDMRKLALPLYNEFVNNGFINEITAPNKVKVNLKELPNDEKFNFEK